MQASTRIAGALFFFGLVVGGGGGPAFAQLASGDPWPKFAHDEHNSGRALDGHDGEGNDILRRGPHATPDLRWWCSLGDVEQRTGGAAIGIIGGVRRVVVGTNDGRVLVFRFHPAVVDCSTREAEPDLSISLPSGEKLLSTPLFLPDGQIIIQTTDYLRSFKLTQACCISSSCSELEPADCTTAGGTPKGMGVHCGDSPCAGSVTPPVWEWSVALTSGASSPTFGKESNASGAASRVFAVGDRSAVCIDPSPSASPRIVWQSDPIAAADTGGPNCPALGPAVALAGEEETLTNDKILWTGVYNVNGDPDPEKQFVAFRAKRLDSLGMNDPQPRAWAASIQEFVDEESRCFIPGDGCSTRLGAISSPVVSDSGRVVLLSDDGGMYTFYNRLEPDDPELATPNLRFRKNGCQCISATPATTQDGDFFFWREDDRNLQYVRDTGDDFQRRVTVQPIAAV